MTSLCHLNLYENMKELRTKLHVTKLQTKSFLQVFTVECGGQPVIIIISYSKKQTKQNNKNKNKNKTKKQKQNKIKQNKTKQNKKKTSPNLLCMFKL